MTDPRFISGSASLPLSVGESAQPFNKAIDLAVLKRGAKDYLEFLDATKEAFFAYLYHRTGSLSAAESILSDVYVDSLGRSMSLWRMGSLTFKSLLDAADKLLRDADIVAADIDTVYLQSLPWLDDGDRTSVGTLHDALWSLPVAGQRLLILSLFVGLPIKRIAAAVGKSTDAIEEELKTATDLLLTRWQPSDTTKEKMNALMFIPGLDIQFETKLRFHVVEKYSALRFRRAQWVILGGLFAVLSNVIVASVLAFAVITTPPTSTFGVQRELASMDAILLQRQIALNDTRQSLSASFEESKRIVAHDTARDFTILGLAVALEALKEGETMQRRVDEILQIIESAGRTAMLPVDHPIVATLWDNTKLGIKWLAHLSGI